MLIALPPPPHELTFGRPQTTVTIPAGWAARKAGSAAVFTRAGDRVVVRPCRLRRAERDMTGRHAARVAGQGAVPARGGGCVKLRGPGASRLAERLRARLGTGDPEPFSIDFSETVARAARARTLALPRATGTAVARAGRVRVDSTWEYDLPARYSHQVQMVTGSVAAELVRDRTGDHVRGPLYGIDCWGETSSAKEDDALEPRLELQEANVPPSTKTAWQVAYAPASVEADGTQHIRWTGFVADGEAVIGPDGLLRSVSVSNHGQAVGRSAWDSFEVAFTGFPATVTPVAATPAC